jgi:hypothetical protein
LSDKTIATTPIDRAQRLIRSLPREGLQALLLETDTGRTFQELLALTMTNQDEANTKHRGCHGKTTP